MPTASIESFKIPAPKRPSFKKAQSNCVQSQNLLLGERQLNATSGAFSESNSELSSERLSLKFGLGSDKASRLLDFLHKAPLGQSNSNAQPRAHLAQLECAGGAKARVANGPRATAMKHSNETEKENGPAPKPSRSDLQLLPTLSAQSSRPKDAARRPIRRARKLSAGETVCLFNPLILVD